MLSTAMCNDLTCLVSSGVSSSSLNVIVLVPAIAPSFPQDPWSQFPLKDETRSGF